MSIPHPRDEIAIVGIGASTLSRHSGKSVGHLATEAARAAILDAGLDRTQIDGMGGVFSTDNETVWHGYVAQGLGIDNLAWIGVTTPPSGMTVVDGARAVATGTCKYALCFHAKYRWDNTSASAANDPLRRSRKLVNDPTLSKSLVEHCAAPTPLAAYMRRFMHETGARREHFGMVAVNNRTNAQKNPRALFHGEPLSLAQYLDSAPIYEPFTMHDMDAPMDGAMAVIVTTAERAADLPNRPVILEANAYGVREMSEMVFHPFDTASSHKLVLDRLWEKSGCGPQDIDLANVYDGFTIMALSWLQAAFCDGSTSITELMDNAWDARSGQLKLFGRIPVATHGGNLSEGRVQGMGHVLEGVAQIRGQAGERQLERVNRVLVTNGTNPVNVGMILRAGG